MKIRTEHAERQILHHFVRGLFVCMLSILLTWPEVSNGEDMRPAESGKTIDKEKTTRDTFQELLPIEVPSRNIEHLKKRGLSPETVSGMLKPDNWSVDWSSFTPGCRLTEQNGHWRISGAKGLVLKQYTVSLTRTRRFHISLTAEAMAGEAGNAEIQLGIVRYGCLQTGWEILIRREIETGKTATLEAPLFFERGTPRFRIILKITGDVILKEMVLTELPDDLAQDGITLVEGTVEECSAIPDPQKSDYPDCRFTMRFLGNHILRGASCPREVQLLADGFLKYRLLPTLLTEKLAVPIDFYRAGGHGPMTSFVQLLNKDPEKYLKGKKVLICAMGVRHLHDGVRFSSIREMDRQALLLGGKSLKGAFSFFGGNTEVTAKFAKNLDGAEYFTLPADGKCRIAEIPFTEKEAETSACLSVPVCAKAPCPAKLEINGIPQTIPECYGVYHWNKIVTELPSGTERVKIELTGEPGTVLAVGDIQIYQ